MLSLPKEFLARAKEALGEEYDAFLAAYERPAYRGIRVNTLKCEKDVLQNALGFPLEQAPFSPLSFYAPADFRAGHTAAHHAGMFYSQEPSAASAVTVLEPLFGERILDLCAAPGGKSTQIAALTGDTGLLWANEIVPSRAFVLSSNLERTGVKNAVVSSCHPAVLCKKLAGFFDRVLVDAPCSGEGMFRHDPAAVAEWTPDLPCACAARQAEILDSAAMALRAGGILVYSTCTFSRKENEETVLSFLDRHPDFELVPIHVPFGRRAFGIDALRVLPLDGGEGHFVAKLQKKSETACVVKPFRDSDYPRRKEAQDLYRACFTDEIPRRFAAAGTALNVLPDGLPDLAGLGVLRAGYTLAQIRDNRLEPAHGAFLCHSAAQCQRTLELGADGEVLRAFLRGEEIACGEALKGYTAVSTCGVVTGFGKASGGRLKNKYPKGLREMA